MKSSKYLSEIISTAQTFSERHENSNVHRKYVLELVAKFPVANQRPDIKNSIKNEKI